MDLVNELCFMLNLCCKHDIRCKEFEELFEEVKSYCIKLKPSGANQSEQHLDDPEKGARLSPWGEKKTLVQLRSNLLKRVANKG